MSTAVLIDFGEIRQIRQRTANPSDFTMIARRIDRAARKVKKEWSNLSVEDREALKALAYDLIEPPKGVSILWLKLWVEAYMVFIKATGQQKAFYCCIEALDYLVDIILDAIEREDSEYQQVLSDTLEELSSNPGSGEPVDADKRGWLQQVSDQTIRKV